MRKSQEVKQIQTTVYCDICGEDITDNVAEFWFVGYSNSAYDGNTTNPFHQGYVHGDYCKACIKSIQKAFSKIINEYFYERYGSGQDGNIKLLEYIDENNLREDDY